MGATCPWGKGSIRIASPMAISGHGEAYLPFSSPEGRSLPWHLCTYIDAFAQTSLLPWVFIMHFFKSGIQPYLLHNSCRAPMFLLSQPNLQGLVWQSCGVASSVTALWSLISMVVIHFLLFEKCKWWQSPQGNWKKSTSNTGTVQKNQFRESYRAIHWDCKIQHWL